MHTFKALDVVVGAHVRRPTLELLVIASVFGIPTGVGVYLASLRVLGTVDHGLAIVAGLTAGVALAGVVIVFGVTGDAER